jgi:hypothetical protein
VILFGLEVPLPGAAAINLVPHGAAVASQAVGAMPPWLAGAAHTAVVSAAHGAHAAASAALLPHAAGASAGAVTQALDVLEVAGLVGAADLALRSGRTLWEAGREFRAGNTEQAKRLLQRAWTEARPLRGFVDVTDWALEVLDLQQLPEKARTVARGELVRLELSHG